MRSDDVRLRSTKFSCVILLHDLRRMFHTVLHVYQPSHMSSNMKHICWMYFNSFRCVFWFINKCITLRLVVSTTCAQEFQCDSMLLVFQFTLRFSNAFQGCRRFVWRTCSFRMYTYMYASVLYNDFIIDSQLYVVFLNVLNSSMLYWLAQRSSTALCTQFVLSRTISLVSGKLWMYYTITWWNAPLDASW